MPIWDDYPKKPWYIEGFQPLLLSSCARCQLGGTIKIYTSYFEAYAAMREISKSLKDKLLDAVDDAIGSALLSPVAPILKMCGLGGAVKSVGEFGRGFVTGVAKGLAGTFEGIYNLVVHPLDTLGGMATMAGVAVVGYAQPIPGVSPEERLQKFDDFFGTNLAVVNEGIKQSLEETGDKFLHGTNVERGEVAGQAVEFVAEIIFGSKGAGVAMKAAKTGSMDSKVAKAANMADKVADIVKSADGKVRQWTLDKLPKGKKGIFGKKKNLTTATKIQKGFEDLVNERIKRGLPKAGSKFDNATVSKLKIDGEEFYGVNSKFQNPKTQVNLKVNAQTKTHAEADAIQQAINSGKKGTSKEAEMWIDREVCDACGKYNGIGSLARELEVEKIIVHTPNETKIYYPPKTKK
jgi:hypothetical protein